MTKAKSEMGRTPAMSGASAWRWVSGAAVALGMGVAMFALPSGALAEPEKAAAAKAPAGETEDILILRNGTTLKGKILSENTANVKFKGLVNGIPFETDYPKNEILEIKRGVAKAVDDAVAMKAEATPATTPEIAPDAPAGQRYVYLELAGEFGEDITETPIRDAMKEARKNKADVIIMMVDAKWYAEERLQQRLDVEANFDELFRAEAMIKIFVDEMPPVWDKMPKIVFWVKQAMGGAAFLPLFSRHIYFHPEARLGGVGNLGNIFGGRGHERVVAKQVSLRLQHAAGWANVGGYPESLVRAMTIRDFVLSVKFEGGKPNYFERMPESPDEILLTDDGKDGNQDGIAAIARGEGNDVLTLKADMAQKLGVSQGTIENKQELLATLGLNRSGVDVTGRGQRIMKDWSDGLVAAKRQLKRLRDEFNEVRLAQPGGYDQRTAFRGTRKAKLEAMKALLKRWGEAIDQQWMRENGIPSMQIIDDQLEAIRIEQLKDKK